MAAWQGGPGALHAAANGSPYTHTPPHPCPPNPCTAPSSLVGLTCSTRGPRGCAMRDGGAQGLASEGCMACSSSDAHCPHSATAPSSCPAACSWHSVSGVPLLCCMLSLYSHMPSAIQCLLPVGCYAGKHAVRAGRHRQQAQLCLTCCRHSYMQICSG
jgi:hypothetical protein